MEPKKIHADLMERKLLFLMAYGRKFKLNIKDHHYNETNPPKALNLTAIIFMWKLYHDTGKCSLEADGRTYIS